MFGDNSFDVVLQIDALQHLQRRSHAAQNRPSMGRTGVSGLSQLCALAQWLSILGRMPVTRRLPYQWYGTPNIRVGALQGILKCWHKNRLRILDSFGLGRAAEVRWLPNARAGGRVPASKRLSR